MNKMENKKKMDEMKYEINLQLENEGKNKRRLRLKTAGEEETG
jgi:hypothetical protein